MFRKTLGHAVGGKTGYNKAILRVVLVGRCSLLYFQGSYNNTLAYQCHVQGHTSGNVQLACCMHRFNMRSCSAAYLLIRL